MKPYYEHAGITIYHGDCREILPQIGRADLVFTSPPYNLGVTTGGGFGRGGKWTGGALAFGYGIHDDAMPPAEYEEWQREVLRMCWTQLSEAGAIFYNHKPRVQAGELWTPLVVNPSLPVRQIIIWARAGGVNFAPTHYLPTHEWILLLAKPAFRLRDKSASGVGDVWYVPQESGTEHPAPFPLALPTRAIETTSAATILDPFAGSGTTLLAAKNLGRKAIGIELEERYCEIAAQRLSQEVMTFEAA